MMVKQQQKKIQFFHFIQSTRSFKHRALGTHTDDDQLLYISFQLMFHSKYSRETRFQPYFERFEFVIMLTRLYAELERKRILLSFVEHRYKNSLRKSSACLNVTQVKALTQRLHRDHVISHLNINSLPD